MVANMRTACLMFATMLGSAFMSHAETIVDRLIASYDGVQSLSCEVRKDTEQDKGPKVRMLSRVFFQRPDRLHVETYSPLRRRIVADGKMLFSYIEVDPRGYKKPVDELDREWKISLRKVPATAMDHLMRIQGAEEVALPAESDAPVRAGYQADQKFVVLNLDASNRLIRIDFYESSGMTVKSGTFRYSDFTEAVPGAWIPRLHEAEITFGGVVTRETTRIINLQVNGSIAPDLFVPGNYFQKVEFTDDFSKIYGH